MAVKGFPFEIFHPDITSSFHDLADEYSIPVDYFGTAALFTVAALSGNMYRTELNGSIKNILFGMLIGPSGTGKTPAFDLLCGNIIEPLNAELWRSYDNAHKDWREKKEAARLAKVLFTEPEPVRRVRIATGGTMEGIMKHSMTSPAGFGLFYDEGGVMLGSPNQYKKDTSSVDFWNKMWNGQPFDEMRADSSRERYIDKTSISVLVGMQEERISRYFSRDTVESGLPFRFLFTVADEKELNINIDFFNTDRRGAASQWRNIVTALFRKGANNYFKDDQPYNIPFTVEARQKVNEYTRNFLIESNILRGARKRGDATELMILYDSKLYQYFSRFMIILALLDSLDAPVIDQRHVDKAYFLYQYYRAQAKIVFNSLQDDDLTSNERMLLDALPDGEFGRDEIKQACAGLKASEQYFDVVFRRKFRNGFIKRIRRGIYQKED